MGKTGRRYSPEFRRQIVELAEPDGTRQRWLETRQSVVWFRRSTCPL